MGEFSKEFEIDKEVRQGLLFNCAIVKVVRELRKSGALTRTEAQRNGIRLYVLCR